MAFNHWNLPNQANKGLQRESRDFAKLLDGGRIRNSLLDLTLTNFGATEQEPFFATGSNDLVEPGVELPILQFQMRPGMAGVVTGLFHFYDPGTAADNWIQGDGQLEFFLSVDYRYVPNFINLVTALGTTDSPQSIPRGIPVMSGQLITYSFIFNPTTSPADFSGLVVAGVQGVILPIR